MSIEPESGIDLDDELTVSPLELLMAAGVALVLFAFVAAAYRIARRVPMERFGAAGLIVGIALIGGEMAAQTLIVLVSVILVGALFVETLRWKKLNPEDYARMHRPGEAFSRLLRPVPADSRERARLVDSG